jgi:MFS family permease
MQDNSSGQWGNLALLRLGAFGFGITGFFMAMDAVILPVLVLELVREGPEHALLGLVREGAKNTLLGLLGFSGLLVAALVQPVVGWYSDRTRSPLGRRVPYMLWGCIAVSLGLVGLGAATNYLSLFVMWVLIQANASIGFGPFQALIRDLVPINRIGVASSLKILADAAGGVVLIAVTGTLMGRFTIEGNSYWLWIALGVVGASLIVTAAISSSIVVPRERAVQAADQDIWQRLRLTTRLHPQLAWFLLSRYLMIAATFVFPTYGLFYLDDVVQVSNPAQTLGLMIAAIGGAVVLSVYPAGWLSDRIGHKRVVLMGSIGAALGLAAMTQAVGPNQVLIVASLTGAAVGVVLTANWALANELGTAGREGQHIGLVSLATIGGAATAKLMGPGVDLLNLASPGAGYTALLLGAALLFLLGALVLLLVKPNLADSGQKGASG